jgi:3-oxoacyl-[acyl-carrier-protein] synthase III
MPPIFICAPRYRHGELSGIECIPELMRDSGLLETLRALGLQQYSVSSKEDFPSLILGAISDTLDDCGLDVGAVDAIVYASTGYAAGSRCNDPSAAMALLDQVVSRLEMPNVVPYGISFSRCVNTVHAADYAASLVASGRHANVLVLAADSMQEGFSRIVDPGISVVSDVASCMLVSGSARSEVSYLIAASAAHVDWTLSRISSQENFPEFFRRTVDGMACVSKKLLDLTGCLASDHAQLITNTVNRSVVRIFSQATGVSVGRIFSENVSKLGHCDGADLIVNLRDYSITSASSQSVMAIANGPFMWGGLSLLRVS